MLADFSVKEAAAIADVPEPFVRKAIEAKTIYPRAVWPANGAPRYRFDINALIYLKVLANFPLRLSKEDKQALWEIIDKNIPSTGLWHRGDDHLVKESNGIEIRIGLRNFEKVINERLEAFQNGRRRIVQDPEILSGEPVFKGTRIPLHHICALIAKEVPIEEIKEDYPALTAHDLMYATMVARMKPNPGRPRKPLALLRDGKAVITKDHVVRDGEAASR